jgi:hypothetical protein
MVLLMAGFLTTACARPVPVPPRAPASFDRRVTLNGHPLSLHLAPGRADRRGALVVYATGDGGWRGKDRDLFGQLERWGYLSVGFSAPEYLKHLPSDDGTTTPARLSMDYATIIDATREALGLPSALPVVLVGVSRGADLAVVAAGQPGLRPELKGVVAIALTREEEYVRRRRRPQVAFELYSYLPRLGDLPLAVIQSTRDNYMPADAARELFGADTDVRQFHAVDARNHSFAGARPQLYATLRQSLEWLDGRVAAATP